MGAAGGGVVEFDSDIVKTAFGGQNGWVWYLYTTIEVPKV
jgi:hypothetical protein